MTYVKKNGNEDRYNRSRSYNFSIRNFLQFGFYDCLTATTATF